MQMSSLKMDQQMPKTLLHMHIKCTTVCGKCAQTESNIQSTSLATEGRIKHVNKLSLPKREREPELEEV